MIFDEIGLQGAYVLRLDKIEDKRGFFARSFCRFEFEKLGLRTDIVQCNISFNQQKGTLRGVHFQTHPYEETKLVRCTQGAIYDVIVDLRSSSETFRQWVAVELTAGNRKMLYVPEGVAHGFQTIEDNTEVFYQMSEFYHPESASGIRWNDPAFNIRWPEDEREISEKDRQFPNFQY